MMKSLATSSIFADQTKAARIWRNLFVLSVIAFAACVWKLSAAFENGSRILVVDGNTYYLGRTVDHKSASALHNQQAYDAAESLFDCGPLGPDHPERLKRLFDKPSYTKALEVFKAQAEEFRAKELHQKIEIAEVSLIQVKDESVLASFHGQLVRSGVFKGKPFIESLAVRGNFTFSRNPNMVANGAFPTLVRSFDIEIQPILSQ